MNKYKVIVLPLGKEIFYCYNKQTAIRMFFKKHGNNKVSEIVHTDNHKIGHEYIIMLLNGEKWYGIVKEVCLNDELIKKTVFGVVHQ